MAAPGFRRPTEGKDDQIHRFSRPPRDFEKVEAETSRLESLDGSQADEVDRPGEHYEFTIEPADLTPPLTDWLKQPGGVQVEYYSDLDGSPKGSYHLRAKDVVKTQKHDWAENPIRVVLKPVE